MDLDGQNNMKRWLTLAIFVCAIIGMVCIIAVKTLQDQAMKTTTEKLLQTQKATATQLKTKSGFRLKVLNKLPVRIGDDIELGVYANSAKMDAVGFDLALSYSKSLVYVGNESMLKGYDIIETVEPDSKLIITGAKQLGNDVEKYWNDQQIMILKFKAQKAGLGSVSFDLSPGSLSDTNMFNNQNKDLVTIAIGATVQIQ